MTAPAHEASRSPLSVCPCCDQPLGEVFYRVGPVPVHSCLMLGSAGAAADFPTGAVELAQCPSCGFVTNRAFDPAWSAYAPNYEDQQSFSPTFNSFARALAQDLVEDHRLAGKSAVEIGSSKGDFLALLCEAGMAETVGIDPSVVEGRVELPSQGKMRLIQAYYGAEHFGLPADLICCRHTLEHIQPVLEILQMMRRHAENTPGAVLCIEVPDAARLWSELAFEDIYYEHCSYFTPGSLAEVVRRAGFAVTDLRRDFDDQYLVLTASTDPSEDRRFAIESTAAATVAEVADFAARVMGEIAAWQDRIDREVELGHRIAVWGSGSKCVSFLRTLKRTAAISAIVDINPHRAGKYAPGLTMPISAPSDLAEIAPDTVIVMNAIYLDEIRARCGELALFPRFLTFDEFRPHGAPQ